MVIAVYISNSPAVGNDVALKTPLIPQDGIKELIAAAAGLAQVSVVRTHHRKSIGFLDAGPKMRQVGFPQVALIGDGIESVPVRLGTAVHGIMLRGSNNLQIT
ncbi:hypothetical protein ES703_20435 [subsurface metagenome]